LVFGDAELDRGVVQLKDLAAHQQTELPRARIAEELAQRLLGSTT
jgi:histidyl-tRNA synthetase